MKESWKQLKLGDVCSYVNTRILAKHISIEDYISTENMLPNKGGISCAASVPASGAVTAFEKGQVLVSNIRPYFRKIWFADKSGGCSNDVLCFEGSELIDSQYLYYLLSQDPFFDYVMLGANGSKMPRGDRKQIMDWQILLPDLKTQRQIAAILGAIDAKIALNRRLNDNLEQQAQAIFKSWFVDFEPFGGKMPSDWREGTLSEIANITMGQSPDGSSYNEDGIGTVFYQGRAEFDSRFPTRRLFTTQPKRMAAKGNVLMSVRALLGI